MNVLISLFDYNGTWSKPYQESLNWHVEQIDIKHGKDILEWDYWHLPKKYYHLIDKVGILAACPCTDYALSGARHFERKDKDGSTEKSNQLIQKTMEIIEFFKKYSDLHFWCIENPMTRLHKVNPVVGEVKQKFHPYEFAKYDPAPDESRYCKQTWLFGEFNQVLKKPLEPFSRVNPGWANLGGKSERTKELRSKTPLGFAYAFYEANNENSRKAVICQPELF